MVPELDFNGAQAVNVDVKRDGTRVLERLWQGPRWPKAAALADEVLAMRPKLEAMRLDAKVTPADIRERTDEARKRVAEIMSSNDMPANEKAKQGSRFVVPALMRS